MLPGRDCDFLDIVGTGNNQLDPTLDIFSVFVYQPTVPMSMGVWPDFKLPYVIFSPGAAQFSTSDSSPYISYYHEMVEAYPSVGFVVFAIQPPTIDSRGADWSVGRRALAMACTSLWAFTQWSEKDNDRLNCDFIVSGHSRGGEAAYFFAEKAIGPLNDLGFEGQILRGIIAFAPRSKGEDEPPYTDVFTSPISGVGSLPYLIFHGANDGDVKNDPLRAYDIYGPEEVSSELPSSDKILIWAHDVLHKEWGGYPDTLSSSKAPAIESLYIPHFLRWQILEIGDSADRRPFTDLVQHDRTSIVWDPSIDNSNYWQSCQPEYDDLDETPVVFANLTLGTHGDPGARMQIDTMTRSSLQSCVSAVSPSSSGENVTVNLSSPSQVCMGSASDLITPVPLGDYESTHPSTSAMRIRWGDNEDGGQVSWALATSDISEYSFLSFRAGQIRHLSPDSKTTIAIGLITPNVSNRKELFSLEVDLYTQDDQPSGTAIYANDFMRTIRVPLSDFCSLGADVTQVDQIVFSFFNEEQSRSILLDSIEFTKSADSDDLGICF